MHGIISHYLFSHGKNQIILKSLTGLTFLLFNEEVLLFLFSL